jgi:hypothetical protein
VGSCACTPTVPSALLYVGHRPSHKFYVGSLSKVERRNQLTTRDYFAGRAEHPCPVSFPVRCLFTIHKFDFHHVFESDETHIMCIRIEFCTQFSAPHAHHMLERLSDRGAPSVTVAPRWCTVRMSQTTRDHVHSTPLCICATAHLTYNWSVSRGPSHSPHG